MRAAEAGNMIDATDKAFTPAYDLSMPTADASPSGTLMQSIPIAGMPGRGNQPAPSLTYNSEGPGDGLSAYGWTLNWAMITRAGLRSPIPSQAFTTTIVFPDGGGQTTSAPQLEQDRYTLDVWGAAMELVYRPTEQRFEPRYQNWWRVLPADGPNFSGWSAQAPDGRTWLFSASPVIGNTSMPNVQFVTEIRSADKQTNQYFTYRAMAPHVVAGLGNIAGIVPQTIYYSCAQFKHSTCYRMEFVFEPTTPTLAVRHGSLVATTERLTQIKALNPKGGVAWAYDFTYSIDPYNGRALMAAVRQQDGLGASAQPATTFQQQEAAPPTEPWVVSDAPSVLPPISYEGQVIEFACPMLRPEAIAVVQQAGDLPVCHLSLDIVGDGNQVQIGDTIYPLDQVYAYGPTILGPWDTGAFFTDLNDDGLPDLVRRFQGPGVSGDDVPWVLNCLNQGNLNFTCEPQPASDFWWSKMSVKMLDHPAAVWNEHVPSRYSIAREQRDVVVTDIEGDRRAEVVEQGTPVSANVAPVWVVKHLDGTAAYAPMQPLPGNVFVSHARLFDVNGDGASDVVVSYSALSLPDQYWSEVPDPLPQHTTAVYDPLTQSYVGAPWASPVDFYWRQGIDPPGNSTPVVSIYHDLQVQVVDLNGDGLLDLYSMPDVAPRNFNNFPWDGEDDLKSLVPESAVAGQRGIFLNNGHGWTDVTAAWTFDWSANAEGETIEVAGAKYPSFHLVDYPDWLLLDVNGDGLTDFVEASFRNLCLGQAGGGWRCRAAGTYSRPSLGTDDSYVGTYQRLGMIIDHGNTTKKGESLTDDKRRFIPPRYRFEDLNGDRFPDLVENHGVINAYQQQITKLTGHAVLNPLTLPPNRLITTINPLGARTEVGYRTIAQPGLPTGGPRTVVNHVSQWATPAAVSTATVFAYHDPYYIRPESGDGVYDPLRGPEFLGFREVDRISVGFTAGSAPEILQLHAQPHDLAAIALPGEVGRRRARTHYGTGYAYANSVFDTQIAISHDGGVEWTPITTTTQAWHTTETADAVSLQPPYLVLPSATAVTQHVGTEETITTLYPQYNAFGLPKRIENHGRQGYEDSVVTERFYKEFPDPWIVGFLSQETTTADGQYRTITTTPDAFGRVVTREVVASNMPANYMKTTYTYDSVGNVTTATALGALPTDLQRTTIYTYEQTYKQFLMTETNPLTHMASVARYGIESNAKLLPHPSHFGRVSRIDGPLLGFTMTAQTPPHATALSYDTFGRPTTRIQTVAGDKKPVVTTTTTYVPDAAAGTFTTTTQQGPQTARTTTDALGRVLRTEQQGEQGWRVSETEYGPFGKAVRQSAPHYAGSPAQWTDTDADPLGRPILVTTPTQAITYTYPTAFTTQATDGKGFSQSTERDGRGRVIRSVVAGAETRVYFGNDPQSTIQINEPGGTSVYLQQNGLGMVTERLDADRGTWRWTYDGDGNVVTQTDGDGKATHYRYDALGRQTHVDWGDDGSAEIRTYYDGQTPQSTAVDLAALGQVSADVDPSGETRIVYSKRGLPLFINRQIDGVWHKLAYTYDALGRLTEYAHRQANTVWPINLFRVQYRYGLDGVVAVGAQMGSAPWQSILSNVHYGEDGQLESRTYGNGLTETFGYTPIGRQLESHLLQGSGGKPLLRFGYGYDALDASLTNVTDLADDAYTQSFAYAADKTLQHATSGIYPATPYVVPSDGRMTQHGPWTLEYGDLSHPRRVTKAKQAETGAVRAYQYTPSGDVLLADDRLFGYDPAHRVTHIQSNRGTLDITYDGHGTWVKQVVGFFAGSRSGGGDRGTRPTERQQPKNRATGPTPRVGNRAGTSVPSSTGVPNPPALDPIIIATGGGVTLRPFDSLEIVTPTGGTAQRRYHVIVGGQRVATMIPGGTQGPRYYHTDHLGSRVLTTDKNGAPIGTRIGYTPYGSPVNAAKQIQWTDWEDPSQLFTGIALAQITDLYLTTFRIYDPVIGRFLQPDPIAQAPTSGIRQDPYLYASATPTMFVDPLGLADGEPGEWETVAQGTAEVHVIGGDSSSGFEVGLDTPYTPAGVFELLRYTPAQSSGFMGIMSDAAGVWGQDVADLPSVYTRDKMFETDEHGREVAAFYVRSGRHRAIENERGIMDNLTDAPNPGPAIVIKRGEGLATALHELGHHYTDQRGAFARRAGVSADPRQFLNRSGEMDDEAVAEIFAVLTAHKLGLTVDWMDWGARLAGYKQFNMRIYKMFERCGPAGLATCKAAEKALRVGNDGWFLGQ